MLWHGDVEHDDMGGPFTYEIYRLGSRGGGPHIESL
ncbi:hypothetical protein C7399_13280 [Paraburkholderia tropica]|uniref:Uncharacterized protein n=1 Tax=Paraburkholderia tropica TaxID=92647 RepID=A0ABX5MDW5_9BURK|nr:hypothetical protein C7400_13280 [Paraburkholderia tropica]PZW72538.1 hypothetical protein C7399_13280 [Paraburkholderia tropica]